MGVGPPERMRMSPLEDLVWVVDTQDRGPGPTALLKDSSTQEGAEVVREAQMGARAGRESGKGPL